MKRVSLWSGEEEGESPGNEKKPPGSVNRRSMSDREDDRRKPFQEYRLDLSGVSMALLLCCLWPVDRNGHEDVWWDEVAKNAKENH